MGLTLPFRKPTKTRQAMHAQRNIEVCSRNHCCRGKGISIKYSQRYVNILTYAACKAPALYYTAICGQSLSGFTTLFHIISWTGKCYWTQNVFWSSLQFLSQRFLVLNKKSEMYHQKVHWCSCKISVILVRF